MASIAALFSADLYFVLLPKLQRISHGWQRACPCGSDNLTTAGRGGLHPSNWTSSPPTSANGAISPPPIVGSKLERLFMHPLYDIHILPLAAEERLLEKEQLLDYYMKKVSRWERSDSSLKLLCHCTNFFIFPARCFDFVLLS